MRKYTNLIDEKFNNDLDFLINFYAQKRNDLKDLFCMWELNDFENINNYIDILDLFKTNFCWYNDIDNKSEYDFINIFLNMNDVIKSNLTNFLIHYFICRYVIYNSDLLTIRNSLDKLNLDNKQFYIDKFNSDFNIYDIKNSISEFQKHNDEM